MSINRRNLWKSALALTPLALSGVIGRSALGQIVSPPASPLSAKQLATLRAIRQQLPSKIVARNVMATAPTTTFTTTNALSAGRWWPAVSATSNDTASQIGGNAFSTSRAAAPAVQAQSIFSDTVVLYRNVNYGSGVLSANQWQQSIIHSGSRLIVFVKGQTGLLLAKINDQFVSLTPQAVANDAGFYYWDFNFGASDTRRVDIIGSGAVPFGGFYTALTDTVMPAPLRGPRVVVVGDSYMEGTGATASAGSCFIARAMDSLGWDNYLSDGRGSSGILALGNSMKYRDRFATDVAPYNPDLIIVQGSINDSGFTGAQLATEIQAFIALAVATFPNVVVAVASEPLKFGATFVGNAPFLRRDAIKTAVLATGHIFLDLLTLPLPIGYVPATNTLASAAAQFATSISLSSPPLVGAVYQFADKTPFLVKSFTGTGPYTVITDTGGLGLAQLVSSTMTQVGDCPWTGTGNIASPTGWGNGDVVMWTDGAHPTQVGHDQLGELYAALLATAIKAA